jgi:hypothetical protein
MKNKILKIWDYIGKNIFLRYLVTIIVIPLVILGLPFILLYIFLTGVSDIIWE